MSEQEVGDRDFDRYVINVERNPDRVVVLDTAWPETDRRYVVKVYAGPNRLSDAVDYTEALNARVAEWDGLTVEEVDQRLAAEDMTVTQPLPSLAAKYAAVADEFLEGLDRRLKIWNENRPADRVPLVGDLLRPYQFEAQQAISDAWMSDAKPTPAEFLGKTLPAYARRQRLTSMLVEVTEVETAALALLAEDMTELNRAVALRRKLTAELESCASPSGSTESAQNDSVVPTSTPGHLRNVRASLYGSHTARGISKPGPY